MASKKDKAQKSLTKEEELLLQDFSRNVSTKSSALFYGNALIVSAIPICKCATSSKILIKIYVQIAYVYRLCWIFLNHFYHVIRCYYLVYFKDSERDK